MCETTGWRLRQLFRILIVAVPVGMLLIACSEEQAAPEEKIVRPVKVIKLASSTGSATREYPGQVRAAKRVELSFEVAGKLKELPIREGQILKKGDLVARLDDRDFASTLKSAQAEFNNAQANFRRGSKLVKDGNISKTDYDKLRAQRDVTSANLAKAKKSMADTRLLAPFSGRVANRFVENFQDVNAKQPIISLQDIEKLEILVDVPESRVIRRPDPDKGPPKMQAVFEAFPDRRFDLTIKEFSTEADPNTQSFRVALAMAQPDGITVLPGMTATVQIELDNQQADGQSTTFTLPAIAVFADESGTSHVWVVDAEQNTVQRRAVETGDLAGSDSIRIDSGLEPGEIVAVSAVTRLRDGMEIRPVEKLEF